MGTSSSFRSPKTPRWDVFNRALDHQLPLERLRVTLFLAGEAEWRQALDAPALANFAEVLVDAHGSMSTRLAHAEHPASVIAAVVTEARSALFDEAYSPALPVAERALRVVLVQTAQGSVPLADASGEQAAQAWERNRGDADALVGRYIGELFGQWAAHVMARDTARLVDPDRGRSSTDVRDLMRTVSQDVADLAGSVSADAPATDIGSYWQSLVGSIFDRGRALEQPSES